MSSFTCLESGTSSVRTDEVEKNDEQEENCDRDGNENHDIP